MKRSGLIPDSFKVSKRESQKYVFSNNKSLPNTPLPSQRCFSYAGPIHSLSYTQRSLSCSGNLPDHAPCYSTGTSPSTSQGTSPNGSPKSTPRIQFRRANSYKFKSKANTLDMVMHTKLHDRQRSNSTPDLAFKRISFNPNDNNTGTHSCDEVEECPSKENQNSSDSKVTTDNKKSPGTRRKKSLAVLLGLATRDVPDDQNLQRSNSHRSRRKSKSETRLSKAKSLTLTDASDEEYNGPLFQATTLFVPGYDFKRKQSTPVLGRKHSTPFLSRFDGVHYNREKRNSTPNIFRRSDEFSKKNTKVTDASTFPRAVSSAPHITFNSSSDEEHGEFLKTPQRLKVTKIFGEQVTTNIPELSDKSNIEGRVKKISLRFEDGTAYSRRKKASLSKKCHSVDYEDEYISKERGKYFESDIYQRKRSSGIELSSKKWSFTNGDIVENESQPDLSNLHINQQSDEELNQTFPITNSRFKKKFNEGRSIFYDTSQSAAVERGMSTCVQSLTKEGRSIFYDINQSAAVEVVTCQSNLKEHFSDPCLGDEYSDSVNKTLYNDLPSDSVNNTDLCVTEL